MELLQENVVTDKTNHSPRYVVVVDTAAMVVGVLGATLNALLFLVINNNSSMDRKCQVIYQNLAAIDVFNSLVIPLCYLTICGHGYNFDLLDSKDGILYLLFGSTVNIPYMILILLSTVRVMIFRHQVLYSQHLGLRLVRLFCVLCWIFCIGSGPGIWLCFLLHDSATVSILVNLMKVQSGTMLLFTLVTLLLIAGCLVMVQQMIQLVKETPTSQDGDQQRSTCNHATLQSPINDLSECTPLFSPIQQIIRELSSAKRIFLLFFGSILVFSSYPVLFASSFILCGPFYNSTETYCGPLQNPLLKNPKISYAMDLIFLCSMSISNSIILLNQKSFKITVKRIFRRLCFRLKCWGRDDSVDQPAGSFGHEHENEHKYNVARDHRPAIVGIKYNEGAGPSTPAGPKYLPQTTAIQTSTNMQSEYYSVING